MRCTACHETGTEVYKTPRGTWEMRPCSECQGTRVLHCCDGLRADPDPILDQAIATHRE